MTLGSCVFEIDARRFVEWSFIQSYEVCNFKLSFRSRCSNFSLYYLSTPFSGHNPDFRYANATSNRVLESTMRLRLTRVLSEHILGLNIWLVEAFDHLQKMDIGRTCSTEPVLLKNTLRWQEVERNLVPVVGWNIRQFEQDGNEKIVLV